MRKPLQIAIILAVLALVALGFGGGCASTSLPPRLTDAQAKAVETTRFKATVGVEPYQFPVYAEKLIRNLRATGLFERVDALAAFAEPPTFVARVDRAIYGTAAIPLWTGLSLGLIPTTVSEQHGHAFSLVPTARREQRIPIVFSYRGPSTLGWWALVLNLTPDRTWRDVYSHPRFIQGLAWQLVAREREISAYAKAGS